jgi:hypothetical protein
MRQPFADTDPTHTRDTVRSPLTPLPLVLWTLGPMVDQVLFHDLLSEAQDLRILGIDDGPHPMRIRVAKGRYSREVFNRHFQYLLRSIVPRSVL